MSSVVLNVAEKFTRFPAGRFRSDGKFSGERFRDDFLFPALSAGHSVSVVLDGTMGFGSSFLEEAFGGLVRKSGFTVDHLESLLSFVSKDPTLVQEIWDYIRSAS